MMEAKTTTMSQTQVVSKAHRRIGLLGGTFNPPHFGHLMIGDQVANELNLDQVLFMPNAQPPHVDAKTAVDPMMRAMMVKAAIMGNSKFGLEMTEIERGGKSYSYDTVVALEAAHPENDYYFIIGGDEVAYLKTWYRIDDLVERVHFVGVNRPEQPVRSDYPVEWVQVPNVAISSSDIRQRIKEHRSIRYLVPDMVAAYIFKEGLYLDTAE
ncbi:nicotinate-nucleotide adenylyltransferase [Weissella halotolerans]|uniref:Probable nicotinate-nucleotide adenylyltransferase n=1 Tax=Weissella halotolerans DSM 20190 TaxID=1123500 RepID=A0A0R2FVT6_9LACO|nr:nicotinate-nucleotide adenylyltransferase [Weissella halotolerans]KRN32531.1 nicotinic acid mononucleotide adenylyltransferase [Weissella halotolerans DSM 20190]